MTPSTPSASRALQGAVPLSPLHFARNYPRDPSLMVALFLGALGLAWLGVQRDASPLLIMAAPIAAAFANGLYWKAQRQHFWFGCSNPAIVLSTSPWRWAVSTDLGFVEGDPPVPALKVCDHSLARHAGPPLQAGDRIPCVSLYVGEGDSHWDDFDPRPVGCACPDPAVAARVVADIPEAEWQTLEAACADLGPDPAPGLRRL